MGEGKDWVSRLAGGTGEAADGERLGERLVFFIREIGVGRASRFGRFFTILGRIRSARNPKLTNPSGFNFALKNWDWTVFYGLSRFQGRFGLIDLDFQP